MRTLTRRSAIAITLAIALVVSLMPALAGAVVPGVPTLVDIRSVHQPGYDRIVFEFAGGLPDVTRARWVQALRLDPSDKPAKAQGNAFVRVWFRQAQAHDAEGPTAGPLRRAFDLPNIAHLVMLGDYEGEVSIGIGLMERTKIRKTYRLSGPARFVVDIDTGFPKKRVPVYFADDDKIVAGDPVVISKVKRYVRKIDPKRGALQRLYAGPTEEEKADPGDRRDLLHDRDQDDHNRGIVDKCRCAKGSAKESANGKLGIALGMARGKTGQRLDHAGACQCP